MPEKIPLSSRATLLIENVPTSDAVSMGLWIPLGSRLEGPGQRGFSHFIEHMLFKGTTRRSAFDIADTVDRMGGEINAATGRENTSYYIDIAHEHLGPALALLTEMFTEARFDPRDFETERAVLLDEIDMARDDPEEYLSDLFSRCLWGDSPLGHPVIGERRHIERASLKALRGFYVSHYRPERLIVSAAGRVEREQMRELAESLIAAGEDGSARGGRSVSPVESGVTIVPSRASRYEIRDIEQIHFLCGRSCYGYRDPDRYPLILLNTVLGGSFSSRLFQRVREREGLCYAISSGMVSYTDIGEFTIGFSTNMQNAPKVLEEIEGELVKIREEGISPDELALAKSKFRGSYVLARESLGWKMARMALQEMTFGRLIPDEEILDRVRGVRLADVHRVASEMLDSSRFTWAGVGPALQNALFQGFTFTF